jgi:hypothetical protein
MRLLLTAFALLALASVSASATQDVAAPATPSATEDMFDMLFSFDLPNDYSVGIGWDGSYFWISSGSTQTGYCEFYIFDEYGNLVDGPIHQGGGATGWGHRDMCYDGSYMFGSYSSFVDGFADPMTFSGYFVGPINPCRAMAYDGTNFYTCGFSMNLYRMVWDGNWGSVATSTSLSGPWSGCYGLAYDATNGGCLWMSTADYSGDVYQLDMNGNQIAVYSTLFQGYDIHGGCTMACTEQFGNVLAILMQSSPDQVAFYDVEAAPSPADEGSWGAIKALFR